VKPVHERQHGLQPVGQLGSAATISARPPEHVFRDRVAFDEINAVTALQFSKPFTDVDLTECLKALVSAAERAKRGDLAEAEAPGRRRTPTKLNPDSSAYLFRNRKRLTTAKIRRYPSIGQRLTGRPIRRSKSLNRGSGRSESNSGSTASHPSRLARA
jgi:hypothetical protein